jgi:hypothetical protein
MAQAATLLRRITGLSPSTGRAEPSRIRADQAAQKRLELATEARKLLRRRTLAMAVAARCRAGARRLSESASEAISLRAMRRAATLHLRFHRTLDTLVSAGGFEEAMHILHERKRAP